MPEAFFPDLFSEVVADLLQRTDRAARVEADQFDLVLDTALCLAADRDPAVLDEEVRVAEPDAADRREQARPRSVKLSSVRRP